MVEREDQLADLSSHDSFLSGPPLDTFAWLRKHDPLRWCPEADGVGFWSLTRYQDILQCNKDFKSFSSARGIRMEDQTYEEYLQRRTFQETDPPEHTKVRKLVSRAFSKPEVEKFRQPITELAQDIVEKTLEEGEFDAVDRIARALPMRMLGRILGTPDEDSDWLVSMGDRLIANTDPEYTDMVVDKVNTDAYRFMPFRSPAGAELYDYAKKQLEEKRRSGDTSSLLHLITQPDDEGNVLSETDFRNFFCLLVAAGNDTTRYSIAATIYKLATQPGLLEQVGAMADQDLEPVADEFIRWASPTMHFRRTATQDYELHGKTIEKGSKIILWFISANRDESEFPDAETVDLARENKRHMAFGQGGRHICLGMWIAKLEVAAIIRTLATRLRKVELAGPHEYLRSNFICGIKHLPVRVTLK